jgi:hypothetical protein
VQRRVRSMRTGKARVLRGCGARPFADCIPIRYERVLRRQQRLTEWIGGQPFRSGVGYEELILELDTLRRC